MMLLANVQQNYVYHFLKVSILLRRQTKFPSNPDSFVFNYSNVVLTDTQKEVLSLGPKFCDRPKSFNKINTKLQFENLIHQISDLTPSSDIELEHFRSTVYDCCQQFECSIPKGNRLLTKKHL